MANIYDIPSWAGKPPVGLHLDVLKEAKLVQKLMVDEKRCYLFGRNNQMNDFCIDHASCSRVHAAFVYHKNLNLAYLVDLGSTHGTFIGTLRLEAHKPTQLQINSTFHFGASTRNYILRERPSAVQRNNIIEDLPMSENCDGTLLGLPESQTELDNLTEYNTAHNRRISMLGITEDSMRKQNVSKAGLRKRRYVTFNDEEIIINPEDVDPSVGRFRNLIHSTFVPAKRARFESSNKKAISNINSTTSPDKQMHQFYHQSVTSITPASSVSSMSLYQGLPAACDVINLSSKVNTSASSFDVTPIAIGTKLGLLLPNPAPDVAHYITETSDINDADLKRIDTSNVSHFESRLGNNVNDANEPEKKKYAKESWPGRKPMLGPL